MTRPQIAALVVPAQPAWGGKRTAGDPLSPLAGKSLHTWVVDALIGASVRRIGILASDPPVSARSELAERCDDALVEFVAPMHDLAESLMFAVERLGSELTLSDAAHVLLVPAEAPQIESSELRSLIDRHVSSGAGATLLASPGATDSAEPEIIRDAAGRIVSISDVHAAASGILCIRASLIIPALNRTIAPRWHSGAPLAEIVGVLTEVGHVVDVVTRDEPILLIRSAASRAPVEMELRDRVINYWIERDVIMPDPRQVSIDATVTLGKGVRLLPGTVLEGTNDCGRWRNRWAELSHHRWLNRKPVRHSPQCCSRG